MTESEIGRLRCEIAEQRKAGKRARYSEKLKAKVVECVERRHGAGESFSKLSEALGLSRATLDFWRSGASPARSKGKLRPVVVAEPPSNGSRGFTVEGPRGLRVIGLTLEEVRMLLAEGS